MKRIVAILLLTVMLWGLVACSGESSSSKDTTADQTTPEQTIEQAPAPIRMLMKETTYGMDGNEISCREYEYDENGNLVVQTDYKAGEKEFCQTNAYNEQNLLIRSETVFDQYPEAGSSATYEYNAQGRLIKKCTFDYRGRPKNEIVYEYDELGRTAKVQDKNSIATYTYGENDSCIILEEDIKGAWNQKSEHIYDAKGNETNLRNYDGDVISTERIYEYDEKNRPVKMIVYSYGEEIAYTTWEYPDDYHAVWTTHQQGEMVGSGTDEYDEFGELIKEIAYNAAGLATQTVIYEYGNLGER